MRIKLQKNNNTILMELIDAKNNVIRKVSLIKDNEYIIDPYNYRKKNRGRKVILQEIYHDEYGTHAQVKYLDTLRPGTVDIDDLAHIDTPLFGTNDHDTVKGKTVDNSIIEALVPFFQKYIELLNLIDSRKNESNIAFISQKEMAENLSISPTVISQRIKQLIRYGAIEKSSPGAYKLLKNDLWHTPYRTTHQVLMNIKDNPDLNYREQAELLSVSINDIASAWSYIKKI